MIYNMKLSPKYTPEQFCKEWGRFTYIKETECLEVWDDMFDESLCIDLKHNRVIVHGFNGLMNELLSKGILVPV